MPGYKKEDLEAVTRNRQTLDNLEEGFQLFKTAFDVFYNMDLSMIQALKLKLMTEEGPVEHRNTFKEIKKKKSQRNYIFP